MLKETKQPDSVQWKCGYCKIDNPNTESECQNCGLLMTTTCKPKQEPIEERHNAIPMGDNKYAIAWDSRCEKCKRGEKHYPPKEYKLEELPIIPEELEECTKSNENCANESKSAQSECREDKIPELEEVDIRGKICELTSEMLDNPDDCGIYPTTNFYNAMENFIKSTYLLGRKSGMAELKNTEDILSKTIDMITEIEPDHLSKDEVKFVIKNTIDNQLNK